MITSRDGQAKLMLKTLRQKQIVDQVLDTLFLKQCGGIVKFTEPLVWVLRDVDSEDKSAMKFSTELYLKLERRLWGGLEESRALLKNLK